MKVGGTLSIDSVTPGGGLLPAGTTVRIEGRGFTPSAVVEIEGVVVRSTRFVGTAGNPLDVGCARRSHRQASGGAESGRHAGGLLFGPEGKTQLLGPGHDVMADLSLADVLCRTRMAHGAEPEYGARRVDVSGGIQSRHESVCQRNQRETRSRRDRDIRPSDRVQRQPDLLVAVLYAAGSNAALSWAEPTPALPDSITPALYVGWEGGKPSCSVDPFFGLTNDPPCVVWMVGSEPPKPLVITVSTSASPTRFSASAATSRRRTMAGHLTPGRRHLFPFLLL